MAATVNTASRITIASLMVLAFSAGLIASAQADSRLYSRTLESTVWILNGDGQGSGVLVDLEKRLVITNAHVVGDDRQVIVYFADFDGDRPIVNKQHYIQHKHLAIKGRVLGVDRTRDLAVVELARVPEAAQPLPMATHSALPGETVSSIGNPGPLWTYTSGTVRSNHQLRSAYKDGSQTQFRALTTQAPINHGDSGGPVVNAAGELVAVAQSFNSEARLLSVNVDISEIRDFLDSPWQPLPLSLEELLSRSGFTSIKKTADGGRQVVLNVGNEVSVTVYVTKTSYVRNTGIRTVFAVLKTFPEPVDANLSQQLLQTNSKTLIGGWAILTRSDGSQRLYYETTISEHAQPEAMRATIEYVAVSVKQGLSLLSSVEQPSAPANPLASWIPNE